MDAATIGAISTIAVSILGIFGTAISILASRGKTKAEIGKAVTDGFSQLTLGYDKITDQLQEERSALAARVRELEAERRDLAKRILQLEGALHAAGIMVPDRGEPLKI
ncbi:hypothetical protein [Chelatococcus reniformis]|uniref:Uncharacterized protein n=1 Tax=Chelatococcus reniformis TaxID=1494448 RepID=A0A916UGH3_9HYPH|nr:hypothetical protein [Chelatococcus reniformis]GGC71039.1 hypothetical protein GCM10010994_31960 [Chelatococcus reniformis]